MLLDLILMITPLNYHPVYITYQVKSSGSPLLTILFHSYDYANL